MGLISSGYLFALAAVASVAHASTLSASCSARSPEACTVFDPSAYVPTTPFATARYASDQFETSGWFTLDVQASVPDGTATTAASDRAEALMTAAFAAGVAEGALTCTEVGPMPLIPHVSRLVYME
jgi:hypothetical protein